MLDDLLALEQKENIYNTTSFFLINRTELFFCFAIWKPLRMFSEWQMVYENFRSLFFNSLASNSNVYVNM